MNEFLTGAVVGAILAALLHEGPEWLRDGWYWLEDRYDRLAGKSPPDEEDDL